METVEIRTFFLPSYPTRTTISTHPLFLATRISTTPIRHHTPLLQAVAVTIVWSPHRVYNKLLASFTLSHSLYLSFSANPIVYNMYKHVGWWCFIYGDWKTFTYPKRRYFYWILLTREFARNSVLSPVSPPITISAAIVVINTPFRYYIAANRRQREKM